MEPYKKQQLYNSNPAYLQKQYEKICLSKFIYAEPSYTKQGPLYNIKKYFDLDLSKLRNFKHAYLFCPSPIKGFICQQFSQATQPDIKYPVRLYLYVLEQNQLDSPVAYNENGQAFSNMIQSYTLVIGNVVENVGDVTYLKQKQQSISYEPDFPELKTPFYFQENTKRRFYLVTTKVEDPSILQQIYDQDLYQNEAKESYEVGQFQFSVWRTFLNFKNNCPISGSVPLHVSVFPILKFEYINLEDEIDSEQLQKSDQ